MNHPVIQSRNDLKVMIVEVPDSSRSHVIKRGYGKYGIEYWFQPDGIDEYGRITLPPGGPYSILIPSTLQVSEEEAGKVVNKHPNISWYNYELSRLEVIEKGWTEYWNKKTAIESLHSLIKSVGLDETKNYCILKIN